LDQEEVTVCQPILEVKKELEIIDFSTADDDQPSDIIPVSELNPDSVIITVDEPAVPKETVEVINKTRLRVSYLGFPESSDEWVFFTERKFARFNTLSQGRHGDGRIRPEVKYLSHRFIKENPNYGHFPESKNQPEPVLSPGAVVPMKFFSYRNDLFTSQEYLSLMERGLGQSNGLMLMMEVLVAFLDKHDSVPSLDYIISCITTVSSVSKFLIPALENYLIQFLNLSMQIFLNLTTSEIRTTATEVVENGLNGIEIIIYELYGYTFLSGEKNEPFRLNMGLTYLCSPFLNRRLFGLKVVNELLKRSFSAHLYSSGISKTIIQDKSASSSSSSSATGTNTTSAPTYGPQLPPSYGTAMNVNSPTSIANTGTSTTITTTTTGSVIYSYSYIPVNYFMTTLHICETLLSKDIFDVLYYNVNDIHESIISRSGTILIAFANENLLSPEILQKLFAAGIANDNQTDILKLFLEFIPHLPLDRMNDIVQIISSLFPVDENSASEAKEDVLSEPIVDIINAIALKTRNLLLTPENISSTSTNIEYLQNDDISEEGTYDNKALKLHESCLFLLFQWTNESNRCFQNHISSNLAILQYIIDKLEGLMETGFTTSTVLDKNFRFAFHRHFLRIEKLLEKMIALMKGKQMVFYSSIKLLCAYAFSWPSQEPKGIGYLEDNKCSESIAKEEGKDVPMEVDEEDLKEEFAQKKSENWKDYIPFRPNRFGFASFLLEKYQIYSLLTETLLFFRQEFNSNPISVYANTKVCSNKFNYHQQLENAQECLYVVYRAIDKTIFPKQEIIQLWNCFILEAKATEEYDLFLTFFTKLVTRVVDGTSNLLSSTITTASVMNTALGKDKDTSGTDKTATSRVSFFELNKFQYIETFQALFCSLPSSLSSSSTSDEQTMTLSSHTGAGSSGSFFTSKLFSAKAYKCFEKWFRWINNEMNYLIDTAIKEKIISVSIDPSKLLGIDSFLYILFYTIQDSIALQAVNFLTNLLQVAHISYEFRNKLLHDCISHLKSVRQSLPSSSSITTTKAFPETKNGDQNINESGEDNTREAGLKINRMLLLFNGLLDESYHTQNILKKRYNKCFPHLQCTEGNMVTFKLTSGSHRLKHIQCELKLSMNTKVSDLIQELCKITKLSSSEFKVFRQGKEINVSEYANKTIGHFPLLSEKESISISEKPHVRLQVVTDNTTSTTPAAESKEITTVTAASTDDPPVPSLPPVVEKIEPVKQLRVSLVRKISIEMDYYRLLLDLLTLPSGDTSVYINDLWNTLIQLPTSFDYLMKWLTLDCEDLNDLLPFSPETISSSSSNNSPKNHFCELLYHLQIIEILINPLLDIKDIFRQYSEYYYDIDESKIDQYTLSLEEMNKTGIEKYLELYDTWYDRFIAKNGFTFLRNVFSYISRIVSDPFISEGNNGQSSPFHGISYRVILIGSRLICKIMKFFFLQLLFLTEQNHQKLAYYQFALFYYYNYESTAMHLLPAKLNNNYQLVPFWKDLPAEEKNEILTKLFQHEWGKDILQRQYKLFTENNQQESLRNSLSNVNDDFYFHCIALFTYFCQIDLLHRYHLQWQEEGGERRLLEMKDGSSSQEDNVSHKSTASTANTGITTSFTGNSSSLTKTIENFEKQILYNFFKDLLFLWTSASLLNPQLLLVNSSNKDNQDGDRDIYRSLLECGISGNYSQLAQKGLLPPVTKKTVKTPLNEWFSSGILHFIEWSLLYTEDLPETVISENHLQLVHNSQVQATRLTYGCALLQHVLQLVLAMRPSIEPIQEDIADSSSSTSSNPLSESKKTIFLLTSNLLLLQERYNLSLLSPEVWKTMTLSILQELETIAQKLKTKEISSCNYMEGNMSLLQTFVKTNDSQLQEIFVNKTAMFLLVDLLEIVEIQKNQKLLINKDICER
jgi:hypothetical protein